MKIILRANVPTERWLFAFTLRGTSSVALRQVATGFLRSHPLPSGGSRDNNLHRLATGGYWRQVATASTQAMGPRSLYPVPTSDAEIASDVHARHILHHPVDRVLRGFPLQTRTPDHPKEDGQQMLGGF